MTLSSVDSVIGWICLKKVDTWLAKLKANKNQGKKLQHEETIVFFSFFRNSYPFYLSIVMVLAAVAV